MAITLITKTSLDHGGPRPPSYPRTILLRQFADPCNQGMLLEKGTVSLLVEYQRQRQTIHNGGCSTPSLSPYTAWVPTVKINGTRYLLHFEREEGGDAIWRLNTVVNLPSRVKVGLGSKCSCCGSAKKVSLQTWAEAEANEDEENGTTRAVR